MFQMVRKDFVILLKAAPEDSEPDAYQAHLTGLGFAVELVPVIVFSFVNSEQLRQKLADSEQYGALVLTSKRAVDAVKLSAGGAMLVGESGGEACFHIIVLFSAFHSFFLQLLGFCCNWYDKK